jgi:hypothetical protein
MRVGVRRTGSGSCPMTEFGIRGIKASRSAIRYLVN